MTESIHGELYDFVRAGRILEILCPDGLRPEQYQDALTVLRLLDECFDILTPRERSHDPPPGQCGSVLHVWAPIDVELTCGDTAGHEGPCSWSELASILDSLKASA